MIRRLTLALVLLAMFGFAAAQFVDISPTTDQGSDAVSSPLPGQDEASVDQLVTLSVPQATALHLTQDAITFDLSDIAGENCVYVSGDDVTAGSSTAPGGIAYSADSWDQIRLAYFGNDYPTNPANLTPVDDDQVVSVYPPIDVSADDVDATKAYFVCYRTFIMQLFSNFDSWDLQVSRTDVGDQSIEHLYVQANTCADFGEPTGLFALPDGETGRSLIPAGLSASPTGVLARQSDDCRANSSWMDVLGVLAVKVNADRHGDNTANLTYTLVSSDLP
jgi:hypothetical protein